MILKVPSDSLILKLTSTSALQGKLLVSCGQFLTLPFRVITRNQPDTAERLIPAIISSTSMATGNGRACGLSVSRTVTVKVNGFLEAGRSKSMVLTCVIEGISVTLHLPGFVAIALLFCSPGSYAQPS